jgi:hypothetical protein
MSNYEDSIISKHCDNHCDNPVTVEGNISCSNVSPCDLCIELANIEYTITDHQLKLCELKRNINCSRSPFIRLIPPEIIARISEIANTDVTFMGSLPAVILLSSICSDWRRAVVETPQLWSSIKIDLPISPTPDMDNMLLRLAAFVDEWLGRSGQLPLSISICSEPPETWFRNTLPSKEYRPIFKILNQYSSRWHDIKISIRPTLRHFLQPDCLPLLEQLHITYELDDYSFIAFPPTPRLNTVEIRSFRKSIISLTLNVGIQWHTVTHVSVESITSGDCFSLLRLNPQLVHCTFHNVHDDEDSLPDSPILSSLTYLSFHHIRDFETFVVLDNIKLPCLETLVLSNVIIDPLINFIERSACSLRTLSLVDWQIRKTDRLIPLLQFLSPTLTRLAISSPIRVTKNYLSLLIRIYTSQSQLVENDFLPHLEVFEYSEESPSTLEFSILSERDYPKPVTSTSLRSAYISMASIINKEVPYDLSVILQNLKYESCTILRRHKW